MLQELFRIPGLNLPIYCYGMMLVIGVLAAAQLAKFLARRCGLNPDVFVNAALLAMLAGVVGARLSHVLENFGEYTRADRSFGENFFDAINIRSGGLTYYGGFLLAFPALVFYAVWKKIPLRLGMDIIAPCLMIGLGFGRIGCFLNGCCYGARCDLPPPMSVQFPYHSNAYVEQYDRGEIKPDEQLIKTFPDGARRLLTPDEIRNSPTLTTLASKEHSLPLNPAQLYSTLTAWLLAALLVSYFTLPHAPGRVFALMLMLEGVTRFILEMLRAEPAVNEFFGYGFSLSMELSVGLVVLGMILWFAFGRYEARDRLTPAALPASYR